MPYNARVHRTTILLPDDLDRRLSDAARRRASSRTEVVRQALIELLDKEGRPNPRSIGIGKSSGGASSETVKQAVRSEWRRRRPGG